MSSLTPEQAIAWLRQNKRYLKASNLAADAGISAGDMSRLLSDKKRSSGYETKLSADRLQQLAFIVNQFISTAVLPDNPK